MNKFFLTFLERLGYDLVPIKVPEYKELLKLPRYKPTEVQLLNNSFQIADALSFYYSYQEIFKQEIYRFLSDKANPIIIDCGSNYGTSVLYFKHIFPEAKIIAFEADPYIFKFLEKNASHYQLKDVELHNLALWNKETTISFVSEGADAGRINKDDGQNKNAVDVKTALLSRYIGDTKVDMLKMDIEGAEDLVLKECVEKLTQVENIFIECHSFQNKKQDLNIILSILTEVGFTYQIHEQYSSPQPLLKRETQLGMNLQLNIFGYRE